MTIRPTALTYAPPATQTQPTRSAEPSQPTTAPTGAAAPETGGLSAAERQALARQFPETPTLSLRLYGQGAASEAPLPGAHIDFHA